MTKKMSQPLWRKSEITTDAMPCLLCVDETRIEPNPICFESRLSARLNMPKWEKKKGLQWKWNQRGGRAAAQRCRSGSRSSADVYWHLVTSQPQILSSPYPLPPFLSLLCHCCLSNPLPLRSSQIWLLLLLEPRLKDEMLQMDSPPLQHSDRWIDAHLERRFLFISWWQPDLV